MSEWDYTDLCPQDGLEYDQAVLIAAVLTAAEAWFPGPCSLEPSPPERELAASVEALRKARER